ncbi:MAG TPA: glycosyltransferase [Rhodanobacteraceae bacterium]|nr:glycosyltransferase [Rhodanobacteraceae bacterium]
MPSLPFAGQVCLSMIVRNEAAVIARCLASVRPAITSWAIVDTGSVDGTQDMVRECLADLPGHLLERPWVDFASNRNQALELARGQADYALIIDADEILEIDPGIAAPPTLDAAAYYLDQIMGYGDFAFASAKLLRLDAGWRWRGVLHEYPALDPQPAIGRLAGLRVRSFPDGARSQRPQREKYLDDAAVLRKALRAEPDNARYAFYLAQSLRDAGETAAALEAYRHRMVMGGWAEERWYAAFQVGALLEQQHAPAAEVIDAWLHAFDLRPTRAEPMCELARYLRLMQRHASAHACARAAAELPLPDDLLFVDRSVYLWRARDEQAVSAYYCGHRAESRQLCLSLLDNPALPVTERERIRRNAEFGDA